MRGKLLLVVGFAVGYVLGSRAGRERYDELKRAAEKLWNDPRVQRQVKQAEEFAKDKAPDVVEFLSDGVKKAVSRVSGSSARKSPVRKAPVRKPSASQSKPATSKPATAK
ncbi:MAG: YtxH domain-containing protein [Lacisediminihabitans sp.]